ncbi:hypothetical protein Tco_0558006 [Tanacetum coccineum]
MVITTRSGTTTRDPPYPASHTSPLPHEQASNHEIRSKASPVNPGNETQTSPTYYQPSKSDIPFPSRVKNQKKDEDEKLLNIFKQIHISLPFLEAMIHMPKGAKVLKDLLSHKEKLEKAASSVKLSEECSAVIQKVLEMDKDESVPIILGRPFLATARAVIDVHDGRMSLRVGKVTITFNIRKSIRCKQPHSDYLYCVDQTVKFVHDQWMDIVHLDGK